jgi:sulfatase modifying factor 1
MKTSRTMSYRSLTAGIFGIGLLLMATNSWALVTVDYVPVGNPGNPNDTTGLGSVNYDYSIGTYEVTNSQYTEFLNSVDPGGANSLALYSSSMSSSPMGGITFNSGAADGSKFSIKTGYQSMPVVYVSFFDAMRFTNWLGNGQGSAGTETGTYTLSLGATAPRNPGSTIVIASRNEWYKAAYYDPTKGGSNYWLYPTRSDTQPNSRNGSTTDPNSANYRYDDGINNGFNGGYAVTDEVPFHTSQNYLTNVGAFTLARSHYGTFDQGGNALEWNDSIFGSERGVAGGWWDTLEDHLRSTSIAGGLVPSTEDPYLGFRLAIIPEPGTVALMTLGAVMLAWRRRNSRRRSLVSS